MKVCGVLICGMLILAAVGCGGPAPVPVSGTVTHNSQPVADANVLFTPVGGAEGEARMTATGRTDAQGKFTLTTQSPGDGALPGDYTVSISPSMPEAAEGDYSTSPPPPFPLYYADPTASPLKATVKSEGGNDVTLEIKE